MEIGKDGHLPILDIGIYRKSNWTLGHKVYRKPIIQISIWIPHHTTTHPTSRQFWRPWYTEPEPSVTRTALMKSWFLTKTFKKNGRWCCPGPYPPTAGIQEKSQSLRLGLFWRNRNTSTCSRSRLRQQIVRPHSCGGTGCPELPGAKQTSVRRGSGRTSCSVAK